MSRKTYRLLIAAASVVALLGWYKIVSTGDITLGLSIYAGALGGFGAFWPAVYDLSLPDGLRLRAREMRTGRYNDPVRDQWRALGWPTIRIVLLPVALIVPMALLLPIAFHTSPGDWSILGVLAVLGLLVGPFCVLLGVGVWTMLVLPLLWLARLSGAAVRGERDARHGVGLAIILLGVDIVAGGMVGAGTDLGRSRWDVVIALFGGRHVDRPGLLWLARAGLVLVVSGVVVVKKATRPAPGFDVDHAG